MMNLTSEKPLPNEYAEFYARYVSLVPEGNILHALDRQHEEARDLLRGVTEAHADFRYAAGKWSIKEVVGHVTDTERIFAYRALRFARGDATPLPGFEQNGYVLQASFDDYPLSELAAEFTHVRQGTIALFRHMNRAAWERVGVANGNTLSVRALAYVIAGHELHHRLILRAEYLTRLGIST